MVYETAYASGQKPFQPDPNRGKWQLPSDFIFICIGLSLKLDFMMEFPLFDIGLFSMVPYLICLALYVVPMMVIHAFMGQFSGSGAISALRISPIFKGIGYIGAVLSIYLLMYYSMFAAIPLLYFFNSFRPTLPWSCESWSTWPNHLNETERNSICNITNTTQLDSFDAIHNITDYDIWLLDVPSVEFFEQYYEKQYLNHKEGTEHELSWTLVGLMLFVWTILGYIFYKCDDTPKIGRLLRYAIWVTLMLSWLCFLGFLQLPGAWASIHSYVFKTTSLETALEVLTPVVIYSLQSFGAGWGTVITLASFNSFNTDIMRSSWLICLGQVLLFNFYGILNTMLLYHFEVSEEYYANLDHRSLLFTASGSAISELWWPNLWCLLYFGMLSLAALIVMTTQIFAVLKCLFDEFELLRAHKQEVTFGLIALLATTSFYFATNNALAHFMILCLDSVNVQSVLQLLLLVAAVWVYGRVRLQRDMEFMLEKRFATWKVYTLRFLAPLALCFTLLFTAWMSYLERLALANYLHTISFWLVLMPLLLIPSFGVYTTFMATGSFRIHVKHAALPVDWYPVEAEDRRRYEQVVGNVEIMQQLCEDTPEEIL